jgi:bifunctional oligoribonuclease and PAP phosphatase NrnA
MPMTSSGVDVDAERAAVLDELRAADRLLVVSHENPDGDAIGSLIAMQRILTSLHKDSLMFIAAEDMPLPYEYRFLPLDGAVSELPADLQSRLIVYLDCGNADRSTVGATGDSAAGRIVNIDHHHDNTRFGTANLVDPDASCTAEIVWELLRGLDVELTQVIAEALYVGLITDTGCFMYENTGPRAHLMAAELIEAGVDVHGVYQQVYEGVPEAKLMLLARGLANIERFDAGRLTVTRLAAEDFAAAGAQESYSEGVVDHLRAVRGTAMAALVRDRLSSDGDGHGVAGSNGSRVRKVSLRATDEQVDVSAIARAAGGGGHRAAAGFTTTLPWDELVAFLREQLAAQLSAA